MVSVVIKDSIQALIISLVFMYSLPGAEKMSMNTDVIGFAGKWFGSVGINLVHSIKYLAPFLLAGLAKNTFRRLEYMAAQQSQEL